MAVTLDDSLDATALAELVRTNQATAAELVEAAVERIEARNPALNAVVAKYYDQARARAALPLPPGPFAGVPFLLKDILGHEAGAGVTEGSRWFKDHKAERDSELAKRLRASGLIALGRTNVPELGLLPTTEAELHGPAHNPWSLDRTTGGSSGGAAAAVAARLVPLAHASDGGGSIRIPASCCGVFGLKPTRGRNPLGPDLSESWHGLVVEHAVTVSVRDSAALLDATAGGDPGAPYAAPPRERPFLEEVTREPGQLRIGFSTRSTLGKVVHPDAIAAVKDAAALCEQLGHRVEESEPPVDRPVFTRAFLVLMAAIVAAEIGQSARARGRWPRTGELELPTWLLVHCGRSFSAAELSMAITTLQETARRTAGWYETFDLFLTPTLAAPPARLGELGLRPLDRVALSVLHVLPVGALLRKVLDQLAEELAFEFAPFTEVANATGQPAMSVPLFWSAEGLPIGVHFTARFGAESLLFRLAGQLERARPWRARRPSIA